MHQDSILLATFVVALVAAFLGGIVARMVRLPPVVGYLLGGLAVGPFTPGFIGDSHAMSQLAEVGVMFMMFGTGLQPAFFLRRPHGRPRRGGTGGAAADRVGHSSRLRRGACARLAA